MSRTAHCDVWLEAYSLHRSSSSYSSIPGVSKAVSLMRDMPRVSYMISSTGSPATSSIGRNEHSFDWHRSEERRVGKECRP